MTRHPWVRLAAVVPLVVTLAACGTPQAPEPAAPAPAAPTPPSTTTVQRQDVVSVVALEGVVRARPAVVVRAGTSGTLDGVAPEGTPVDAGATVATVGGAAVVSPVAGTVGPALAGVGEAVPADLPVVEVHASGFGIVLTVPVEHAYRVYSVPAGGTATVTGGPGGVSCDLAPLATQDAAPPDAAALPSFACLLPPEAPVMDGLPAKVGLETARAEGVLVLPVEAVTGVSGSGTVHRLGAQGVPTETLVTLGVSDGHVVEIREGLDEGDEVLAYAPGLGRS